MRLILDTNILIAALIKKSVTRELLSHPDMEYLVSEFMLKEVIANRGEILLKSGLSLQEFTILLESLKEKFIIIPNEEIRHKDQALKIMEQIHITDSIFIALALSTYNDGIWSNDKHFKKSPQDF